MEITIIPLVLLLGCGQVGDPMYEKHMDALVDLYWNVSDLTSSFPGNQVVLRMATRSGRNPPAELFESIQQAVRIKGPDGQFVSLSFDLSRSQYQDSSDSVFPDPPEARITITNPSQNGWYEATVDLNSLQPKAAEFRLSVGAAEIDAKVTTAQLLVTRFAHNSIPVVRRVVVCNSPIKIGVELSEGGALTVEASDALRLFNSSGGTIAGCPLSTEAVLMDGSARTLYYSCAATSRLPSQFHVAVPLGGTVAPGTQQPAHQQNLWADRA